ncbi:otoconin-90 [Pantherophis guttatus]|uniref:Otoconin-90 n=1 Tax=Pantherophis guttatus TaxID=94885 RepID=A0ABM3YNJ6_PANGU|nr:otoconin-90 [Pantherophis guttatus]
MSGRIGRNLTDLWEAIEKSPIVNYTFSGNISDFLAAKLPTWTQTGTLKEDLLLTKQPNWLKPGKAEGPEIPLVQASWWLKTNASKESGLPSAEATLTRSSPASIDISSTSSRFLPVHTPRIPLQAKTIVVKEDETVPQQLSIWQNSATLKSFPGPSPQISSWLQTNASNGWGISPTQPSIPSAPLIQTDFLSMTRPAPTVGVPSPLASPSTEEKPVALKTHPPPRNTPLPALVTLPQRPNSDSLPKVNSSTQGSETGARGILLDLPHAAERNLNNITFFNGVFENVESVALFFDCLGSHFTWLQSVFTSFPPLLNFVSRMKCVTGVCPRDFEDYGCACRFEMEGFPVDEVDGCCFQHRKCYEEATEEECTWDPTKIIMNVSCLTKNITCGSEDSCEHLLCNCDREAIECFLHSPINSSLNNFDASLCSSLETEASSVKALTTVPASELQHLRTKETQLTDMILADVTVEVESNGNTDFQRGREGGGGDVPQEFSDLTLNNHERFSSDVESSGVLETFRGGAVTQKDATVAFDNSELRGLSESYFTTIRTRSTSPGISKPEAEFMPTSEFPRPANSGHLFKIAGEEPVTFSTMIPEASPPPEDSFREVCDRFSFLQRGENGKLKQEFPQLGEMLYCLTDHCPEEFELYGCFCGQEGRGHPTDELDRCCFSHQCCLEQVKRLGCQPEKKSRSEVVCFDHTPTCVGWTLCENLLCSCDKAAAECMASAPFNESWRSPSRQVCQEDTLACRGAGRERPPSSPPRDARTSSEEEESSSEEADPAQPLLRRGKRAIRNGRRRSRMVPLQTR